MRSYWRSAAVLALLLMALPAMSQSLLGTVGGVVKDDQGGSLPGAVVTLAGKAGSRTTTTDATGVYRFLAIDPGTYAVEVTLAGFKPTRRENVTVSVGAQVAIDLTLGVGGITDTITIVGEAPVVDTSSSATNNSLSQDILFNMPIDRRSFNIYNFAPGINDASAYGGGADTANSLLLDGVDTRDPEGGTDWSFFNYNIIQEVQIQGLGAPAEYGAFTGAVVNTISKSGGNEFAGLFDVNYTKSSLASDNLTPQILTANPTLAGGTKITDYLDFTGQLSGPLVKDKLFFFASTQRFHKADDPAGPRTIADELSHRFNGKLSYSPGPNDTFTGTVQFDDYSIKGRSGIPGSLLSNDNQTVQEAAPEWIWNLQWRHLFNSSTFIEAKYLGWWGYYYLDPKNQQPSHFDGLTGLYTGGAGNYFYADRTRNEGHASITHYAEAFGHHDLKFGVELERSTVRDRYGFVSGGYYYDYGGVPKYAYVYSYDVRGKNERNSAYLQDSWKVNDRITINPGIRFDQVVGKGPAIGNATVLDTKTFTPRLGIAFDLTGNHKSVLRAFYGQYSEAALFTFYKRALPGISDYVTLDAVTRQEISRSSTPLYKVDPNLKMPRVDDFNLAFEQALSNDFKVQVTGIYRRNKDTISSVSPSARWTPTTVSTVDFNHCSAPPTIVCPAGPPLTVYTWTNPDVSQNDFLITNPDGFQYLDPNGNVLGTARANRDYKGLQFVVSKRLANRWQTQASYVLSKAEGTVDSNSFAVNGQGRQFETPTLALVNANGESALSRRHEVKLYFTYQIPVVEVGVNAFYRFISGQTYTPFERYGTSEINFPHTVGREPNISTPGLLRLDPLNELDLRLEKIFRFGDGKQRIGLYVDIANVFNKSIVDQTNTRAPSQSISFVDSTGAAVNATVPFGGPLSVIPPRQFTLAARWSF
jgi:hypothetical protein